MLVRVVRADHPKVPRSPPIVHGCMTLRPSRLRGLTSPPTYSPRPRLLYLDVFKSLYQAGLLALVQGPLLAQGRVHLLKQALAALALIIFGSTELPSGDGGALPHLDLQSRICEVHRQTVHTSSSPCWLRIHRSNSI